MFMERDISFYKKWLVNLQHEALELVGLILKIELLLHENRKVIQLAKELDEYENPVLANIILNDSKFRNRLKKEIELLDEIDLDISHVEFMIEKLKNQENE